MDPMTIAALAPTIIGGISSLFGLGKGKEIPKESKETSQSRSWMQNYLQQGLQRGNTPFMGTMPSSRSGVTDDALNMIYRYYSKGKKGYKKPAAQGMQSILGLGGTTGYNPYNQGTGYRGGTGGYSSMGYNPYSQSTGYRGGYGGMTGYSPYGQSGGYGGGYPSMGGSSANPWRRYSSGGMTFRPVS